MMLGYLGGLSRRRSEFGVRSSGVAVQVIIDLACFSAPPTHQMIIESPCFRSSEIGGRKWQMADGRAWVILDLPMFSKSGVDFEGFTKDAVERGDQMSIETGCFFVTGGEL